MSNESHAASPTAVAIALVIRALVLESFYVPSGSMLPTLLIGDHVFVNKFVYGARIPFTDVRLPDRRDPERGEVMIFSLGRKPNGTPCPLDRCPEPTGSEGFVKRIVAIPGDTDAFLQRCQKLLQLFGRSGTKREVGVECVVGN